MWVRLSVWLITTRPAYCLGSCAQSSAGQVGISGPGSYVDSLPGALTWQVLQQLEGRMVIINDKMRVERGRKMPSLQLPALLCGAAETQVNSELLFPLLFLLGTLSSSGAA